MNTAKKALLANLLRGRTSALRLPVCAIHGTKDYDVLVESTQHIEKHHANPANLSVHYIEGGYHDLLADPVAAGHDRFMHTRIESWVNYNDRFLASMVFDLFIVTVSTTFLSNVVVRDWSCACQIRVLLGR